MLQSKPVFTLMETDGYGMTAIIAQSGLYYDVISRYRSEVNRYRKDGWNLTYEYGTSASDDYDATRQVQCSAKLHYKNISTGTRVLTLQYRECEFMI